MGMLTREDRLMGMCSDDGVPRFDQQSGEIWGRHRYVRDSPGRDMHKIFAIPVLPLPANTLHHSGRVPSSNCLES